MNSPDQKKRTDEKETPANAPVDKAARDDEQNQATTEEFDEEGMGVAPKE